MRSIDTLINYVQLIKERTLKVIVEDVLKNPVITFVDVKPLISLEESPASPRSHHSYPGGLIDHTAGVTELSYYLSGFMRRFYGMDVNTDYVVAAALLHDLFKYYQYERDPVTGGFKQREDWWLSHEYAILIELSRRGADTYLIRVISQAHDVGPVYTPEGHVLHIADSIDAGIGRKLQDIIFRACIDIERECNGSVLAVKIFNMFMKEVPLNVAAKLVSKGSMAVRSYIKEVLRIRCNDG